MRRLTVFDRRGQAETSLRSTHRIASFAREQCHVRFTIAQWWSTR